ncbi:Ff.00g114480.m01.CDS01 [Fusarium sp. VM40]|nr:Ff.00g114480.m01.CDS01 [Fusarium sp. VM40]
MNPDAESAMRERSNALAVIHVVIAYKWTAKPNAYVESLVRENQELRNYTRQNQREATTAQESTNNAAESEAERDTPSPSEPSHNPVLEEKPWFLSTRSSEIPILIGEVADAAFATRFRQLLTNQALNHTLRTSYPDNNPITELAQAECPSLNTSHARFLVRVALKSLDGSFHIVRKSRIWELLEQYLQSPQTLDASSRCKTLALLALGELYSSSCQAQGTTTPGLAFFSHASKTHDLLQERPSINTVEVSLLLCLYALCINRRHSAYFLASSAVRHCLVMGLHFNLPDSQIDDPETKEHLNRLWWSAYIMDHTAASISSQIASVSDDDVFVDLPSSTRVIGMGSADFQHTELLIARIHLARVTRSIIKCLYGRTQETKPFLRRVQHALQDLKQWLQRLPPDIQIDSGSSLSKPIAVQSLHLAFNQSVILATRPVLLYMLRTHKEVNETTPATAERVISSSIQTLAEACVRCGRHLYTTVVESWVEGSFKTFDYFNTQYLFSSATILAISSLLDGPDSSEDRENFLFASQLMEKLRDSGSFSATEFCRHLEAIKQDIQGFLARASSLADEEVGPSHTATLEASILHDTTVQPVQSMTSGMALAEPSLEAFLQSEQDLPDIDFLLENAQLSGLYWPT